MKKQGLPSLLLACLFLLTACGQPETANAFAPADSTASAVSSAPEIPAEPEPEVYEVTLMAVGDNLYHGAVINRGIQSDGSYNYDFVYRNITEFVKSYDVAIVNQETMFVDDPAYISSYPCFGTPTECGDALIEAGFDVMQGATNHSFDKGEYGILTTLHFWKQHPEITHLGLYETPEEYNTVTIIERNHIKIALLNYTYGLNGFVLPADKPYLVDTLDHPDKIQRDLEYAEQHADITIVLPHWGVEYVYDETQYQKDWAEFFTEHGADVIIGAHPHVVEPVKTIQSENGNTAVCYYSLGNFVSAQDEKPRMLGGAATLRIQKIVDGDEVTVEITDTDFIPTVTHFNRQDHTVYLLKDYTDELAQKSYMKASPDYLWQLWGEINEDSTLPYVLPPAEESETAEPSEPQSGESADAAA